MATGKTYAEQAELLYHEAQKGDPEAFYKLRNNSYLSQYFSYYHGCCYLNGFGVKQNIKKALEIFFDTAQTHFEKAFLLFKILVKEDNAQGQYNLARCYANGWGCEKDMKEAAKCFKVAADQGHPEAQYELGVCFAEGKGVSKDISQAIALWRKAAEQGNYEAPYQLALCYEKGIGVDRDIKEAIKLWRVSSRSRLVGGDSEYRLGLCYANGEGVAKNMADASRHWEEAVRHGHCEAKFEYALCLASRKFADEDVARREADEVDRMLGAAARSGSREAFGALRLRASEGRAISQFQLGYFYMHMPVGWWREICDMEKAVFWIVRAELSGSLDAYEYLNDNFMYGGGYSPEVEYYLGLFCEHKMVYHQAVDRFGAAAARGHVEALAKLHDYAEKGNVDAQYKLGDYYAKGTGVMKSITEAVKWYRKAAEAGHATAQFTIAKCYFTGHGVPRNDVTAAQWCRKAAENNCIEAQFKLAECYANGIGVERNDEKSRKWRDEAEIRSAPVPF